MQVGANVRLEAGTRVTTIVPKDFAAYDDRDPTAPLNLGQGGVGRRWNYYTREEAANPMRMHTITIKAHSLLTTTPSHHMLI